MLGVVDVELTRWSDQTLVLDHVLELAGLVVHHDDGRSLVLAVPNGEPHFIACFVVFGLDHPLGVLAQFGPLGNGEALEAFVQVVEAEYRDRLADDVVEGLSTHCLIRLLIHLEDNLKAQVYSVRRNDNQGTAKQNK